VIELIDTFIRPLITTGLPYAVTGSVAAMAYGEPRLTNDIDLVLEIKIADIPRLIEAFPEADFYLPPSEVIATEIVRGNRGHLNIISQHSLLKADVYLVSGDALHHWAMENVKVIDIDGLSVAFTPPEYLIIRKLEFFREGGSQKHLRDIAAMLEESSDIIDQTFLQQQLTSLNLTFQYKAAEALVEKF
jgi:predicted nucleotidyltransferase